MFTPSLDLSGLSARNRRIFEVGIRGGDGSEEPSVDELLTQAGNLAAVDDDALGALEASLVAAAKELLANPDDAALLKADEIATAVDGLRTAAAERMTAAEERATHAAEVLSRLEPAAETDETPPEDEPELDAEGNPVAPAPELDAEGNPVTPAADAPPADADAEAEAERLAAAAAAGTSVATRVAARRPASARPLPSKSKDKEFVMRASANVPGVQAGEVLDSNDKIIATFEHALRATGGSYHGPRTEINLMSVGAFDPVEIYGKERTLGRDAQDNERKIDNVTSARALRATGGICAPVPIQYDLPVIGVEDRPVRDAFARFGVPRGGIRLLPPPSLTDVVGAIGVWTDANDITPGSDGPATKPCITLDCPDEVETLVAAITQCLRVGNFRQRFFPEQVAAWVKLVAIQQARVADTRLLNKLGNLSTKVTATQVLGTTRTILATIDRAGASLRSHFRLDPDAPLRFLGPAWLLDNMITDLAREAPGASAERLATSDANIQGFLSARQINASWFLDGETSVANQVFPAQADGLLNPWPSRVICYLYIEGSWLHLDAGMLDFGIVRDSILNGTNDFEMFSEVFEESAFHGQPGTSYRLNIDICPSGEAAALSNTSDLCLGS